MKQSTVFMFSGQGSQYFQMGRALNARGGVFARWMRTMDDIVVDLGGRSVLEVLYGSRSKAEPFDELATSHPAIFMVEYAMARELIESGVEPDLTLGVSLGSVVASAVSGALRMEEALATVLRHSAWTVRHAASGGMLGVLAPPSVRDAPELRDRCVVAAYNSSAHCVLSARSADLPAVESFLAARDVLFSRLPVPYPFHSPWLSADQDRVPDDMHSPERTCRIPLLCCAAARTLTTLPADYLWNVARQPIRFEQAVRSLPADQAYRFVDVGPSGTLATAIKPLLADARSSAHVLLNPYGRELENLSSFLGHPAKV